MKDLKVWNKYALIKGSSIPLVGHKKYYFNGNNLFAGSTIEKAPVLELGGRATNIEVYLKDTPSNGYKKWCHGDNKERTRSMILQTDNCDELKNIGWEVKGSFYSK